MNHRNAPGRQLAALTRVIVGVIVITLMVLGIGTLIGHLDIGIPAVLSDPYTITGSRWTGIISNAGVMVWASTVAVCMFSAWIIPRRIPTGRWRPFLVASGLVTLMLLLDDYFAIHEFADDSLEAIVGNDPPTAVKNALEATVFFIYGLVFLAYLSRFRRTILETEYVLLASALTFFGLSLFFDMLPRSLMSDATGLPIDAFDLLDDGSKAIGIVMFFTYYARASREAIRTAAAAQADSTASAS